MNGLDALLQSLNGGRDVDNASVHYQLGVIGIQMMTYPVTVDEFGQFFCVAMNSFGPRTDPCGTLQSTV